MLQMLLLLLLIVMMMILLLSVLDILYPGLLVAGMSPKTVARTKIKDEGKPYFRKWIHVRMFAVAQNAEKHLEDTRTWDMSARL